MPPPSTPVALGAVLLTILALTIHEWAHAAVANALGDTTAKDLGRLTLNPIRHIHPVMTVLVPAATFYVLPVVLGTPPVLFGGARPVPVVQANLKRPWGGMALVAAAGPFTNFVLAFLCIGADMVMRKWTELDSSSAASGILRWGGVMNVLLTLFNLIPIPPLDGSRIVAAVLPAPLRGPYTAFGRIGIVLVLALMLGVPEVGNAVQEALAVLYDWVQDTTWYALRAVRLAVSAPLLR